MPSPKFLFFVFLAVALLARGFSENTLDSSDKPPCDGDSCTSDDAALLTTKLKVHKVGAEVDKTDGRGSGDYNYVKDYTHGGAYKHGYRYGNDYKPSRHQYRYHRKTTTTTTKHGYWYGNNYKHGYNYKPGRYHQYGYQKKTTTTATTTATTSASTSTTSTASSTITSTTTPTTTTTTTTVTSTTTPTTTTTTTTTTTITSTTTPTTTTTTTTTTTITSTTTPTTTTTTVTSTTMSTTTTPTTTTITSTTTPTTTTTTTTTITSTTTPTTTTTTTTITSTTTPTTTTTTATTTTTTTSTHPPPSSFCQIWGDPHILQFDQNFVNGAHATSVVEYGSGDYWLVKSPVQTTTPDVSIQGRFGGTQYTQLASMLSIAIGGSFISRTLIVDKGCHVTYGGYQIVAAVPSSYATAGLQVTREAGHAPIDPALWWVTDRSTVTITMSSGTKVKVDCYPDHIDAVISMDQQKAGQSGYCGNFNLNPNDDSKAELSNELGGSLLVPTGERLFSTPSPLRSVPMSSAFQCSYMALSGILCKRGAAKYANTYTDDELAKCQLDTCYQLPKWISNMKASMTADEVEQILQKVALKP